MPKLTTVDMVQRHLKNEDDARIDTTLIGEAIDAVSATVERYLGRHVKEEARTEYLAVDSVTRSRLWLKGFPVDTGQPFEVRYDPDEVFGSDTILTVDDEYVLRAGGKRGEIRFKIALQEGPTVRVTYTGGMVDPGGGSFEDAVVATFPDIANAVTQQVVTVFQTAPVPYVRSVGSQGGGDMQVFSQAALIPQVKQALAPHRRGAL